MVTSFSLVRLPKSHRDHGFTLIELLIVIAIILILIAIALPNFLEAQERARVTRGKAHLKTMETAVLSHITQYGFLYADYNDPGLTTRKSRNKSSPTFGVPCPLNPPLITSKGGLDYIGDGPSFVGVTQQNFYAPNLHCPLTSPIKYIDAASTVDPWSDGTIPVGMDSRHDGADDPKFIRYSAYFIAGPDRINGHWNRGHDRFPPTGTAVCGPNQTGTGTAYNPTNGTKSCGDLWMVVANDVSYAKREYIPLTTF